MPSWPRGLAALGRNHKRLQGSTYSTSWSPFLSGAGACVSQPASLARMQELVERPGDRKKHVGNCGEQPPRVRVHFGLGVLLPQISGRSCRKPSRHLRRRHMKSEVRRALPFCNFRAHRHSVSAHSTPLLADGQRKVSWRVGRMTAPRVAVACGS